MMQTKHRCINARVHIIGFSYQVTDDLQERPWKSCIHTFLSSIQNTYFAACSPPALLIPVTVIVLLVKGVHGQLADDPHPLMPGGGPPLCHLLPRHPLVPQLLLLGTHVLQPHVRPISSLHRFSSCSARSSLTSPRNFPSLILSIRSAAAPCRVAGSSSRAVKAVHPEDSPTFRHPTFRHQDILTPPFLTPRHYDYKIFWHRDILTPRHFDTPTLWQSDIFPPYPKKDIFPPRFFAA